MPVPLVALSIVMGVALVTAIVLCVSALASQIRRR